MARIYYEEIQHLRSRSWIYTIVIALTVAGLLPLARQLYLETSKIETLDNGSVGGPGAETMIMIILLIASFVTWLLLSTRLHVIIDSTGIHHRFFPYEKKWSHIRPAEIIAYRIERIRPLSNIHKQSRKLKTLNVDGLVTLNLQLIDGRNIKVGARTSQAVDWAMRKLLARTNEPL